MARLIVVQVAHFKLMNSKKPGYGFTVSACCVAYVLQAAVVNVTPILFIPLREQFNLSFSQLAFFVLANFITQLLCDVSFSNVIDKRGFRPCALLAPAVALLGFLVFALSPVISPQNPYPVMLLGTVIFSGSGGILEVLLSPIVDALPLAEKKKNAAMSFVHAAYSWGQVAVVLITTLLVLFLGAKSWQLIMVFWCVPAVITFFMFLVAPLAEGVSEKNRQSLQAFFHNPTFFLCLLSLVAAGAGELIISQWASSFIEKGLGVSKVVGDVAGVCAFAAAMGTGRIVYGKFGAHLEKTKLLQGCFLSLLICYLATSLLPGRIVPVVCIVLSGFSVSITWPTMLVETSNRFPNGGARLFALLAAGGDTGSSLGPWLAGRMMDVSSGMAVVQSLAARFSLTTEQLSLRIGMLVGALFALLGFLALSCLRAKRCDKQN